MRLPRHDTPLSLPAETPADALAADEALLDLVATTGQRQERWWVAASPAVVIGLGLHHRVSEIVDLERCRGAGVEVLTRSAGGGALLLDSQMICGAICVPTGSIPTDVTESYRWLGDDLVSQLAASGVLARRISIDEARRDVNALRSSREPVADLLLTTCFGALSPHEVAVGTAKLVGLAQIRRRHAALFQIGILRQDQSRLADFLRVPDEALREQLRVELAQRTIGLRQMPKCGMLESSSNWHDAQFVP